MDLALLVIAFALVGAMCVLVLFTVVVIAIRAEDRRRRLTGTGLSRTEAFTRRLVGAYAHHHSLTPRSSVRG